MTCPRLVNGAMSSNRIRELRKSRKLTIEQLATAAGISQPHLSRLESHKRMLLVPVAERIAAALGTTAAEVLGFEGDGEPPPAPGPGFGADVAAYAGQSGDPLSALAGQGQRLFSVDTDAVNKARVHRGDVVIVDESTDRIKRVQALEIVVVRYHPSEELMLPLCLLRQFVPPRLLITNSDKGNLPSIDMDEEDAKIVGVVVRSHRKLG